MSESAAASEAVWLRRLMKELGYPATGPTVIYADNQGAIAMAKNPQFHDRSKHIAVHYHFVREQTEAGTVELRYIPTGKMVADGLTKALPASKFNEFRRALGLRPMSGNAQEACIT